VVGVVDVVKALDRTGERNSGPPAGGGAVTG
jgi:hypothetical protein